MKYLIILIIICINFLSAMSQKIEIFKIIEKSDTVKNFTIKMEIPKLISKDNEGIIEELFKSQFKKYSSEIELLREDELEQDNIGAGPGAEYRNFTIDIYYKVFDVAYDENDIYIVYDQKFESQYSGTAETPYENHFVKILRLSDIQETIKIKPLKSFFKSDENCDAFYESVPLWLPECRNAKINNFSWNLIDKSILINERIIIYFDNTFFKLKNYEDTENDCGRYPSIFGTIKKVEINLDTNNKKYITEKTVIKSTKSFFYSAPNVPKKTYLIKGDEVEILNLSEYEPVNNIHFHGYFKIRYYGKKVIEGWIKKSDVE